MTLYLERFPHPGPRSAHFERAMDLQNAYAHGFAIRFT